MKTYFLIEQIFSTQKKCVTFYIFHFYIEKMFCSRSHISSIKSISSRLHASPACRQSDFF